MKLGYIPEPGAAVEEGGRRYTVLEMERNRIAKVKVEKSNRAAARTGTLILMLARGPGKKITIYLNEDTHGLHMPLYQAVLQFLAGKNVAGATR